jgi:flagellar operon protein
MSNVSTNQMANFQRRVDLLDIARRGSRQPSVDRANQGSFKDMFSRELAGTQELTFSKHAQERLFSRGIELSNDLLRDIGTAVDKAKAKGSRETLVLTEEVALVVSVENRTVITAFDREHLRDGVVTSIDSAVIL